MCGSGQYHKGRRGKEAGTKGGIAVCIEVKVAVGVDSDIAVGADAGIAGGVEAGIAVGVEAGGAIQQKVALRGCRSWWCRSSRRWHFCRWKSGVAGVEVYCSRDRRWHCAP